jgi:YbbR domain-containing protein
VGAFKSLVISPQITGAPKFPYRVMEVDVDPTMVVVSGAAKQLDQTSVVVTDPIDLTQRTDTFTQTVNLSLPYGLSVLQNPSVNVTIHIGVSQPSGPVP